MSGILFDPTFSEPPGHGWIELPSDRHSYLLSMGVPPSTLREMTPSRIMCAVLLKGDWLEGFGRITAIDHVGRSVQVDALPGWWVNLEELTGCRVWAPGPRVGMVPALVELYVVALMSVVVAEALHMLSPSPFAFIIALIVCLAIGVAVPRALRRVTFVPKRVDDRTPWHVG